MQMDTLLRQLFDVSGFVARAHCGPAWTPGLVHLYQAGEISISLAYKLIPFVLWRFLWLWRQNRLDIPTVEHYLPRLAWAFIAFILSCSLSHDNEIIVFQYPAYRIFALVACLTGALSWYAVLLISWVIGRSSLPLSKMESLVETEG